MLNLTPMPAKLLIATVNRRKGEKLVTVAKTAGARGGTIVFGKSLVENRLLQALSLADTSQDVVFIVMGPETEAVLAAVKAAAAKDPKTFAGSAVLVNVPEMFLRAATANSGQSGDFTTRSEQMQSGFKLINVIVNTGFADDVMAEARKAGARGGTILTARGTGTEEDVKFFGISLVPEKEMLLIIAEEDKVKGIIEAIGAVPTLSEPGGGIIFNLNVEEFINLGK